MKYFLVTDEATQWFAYVIALEDDMNKTNSVTGLDNAIESKFLSSIYSREPSNPRYFDLLNYGITFCYCWTISEFEYNKLLKIIEVFPFYKEYLRLIENKV